MTQAITLKFLPCTNTKPDRWKAICRAGVITVSQDVIYNDMTTRDEVARVTTIPSPRAHAIYALLKKLNWGGLWYIDTLYTGEYVAVCVTNTNPSSRLFIEDN